MAATAAGTRTDRKVLTARLTTGRTHAIIPSSTEIGRSAVWNRSEVVVVVVVTTTAAAMTHNSLTILRLPQRAVSVLSCSETDFIRIYEFVGFLHYSRRHQHYTPQVTVGERLLRWSTAAAAAVDRIGVVGKPQTYLPSSRRFVPDTRNVNTKIRMNKHNSVANEQIAIIIFTITVDRRLNAAYHIRGDTTAGYCSVIAPRYGGRRHAPFVFRRMEQKMRRRRLRCLFRTPRLAVFLRSRP